MGKVGRFVTNPKAGAFCQITLDSGDDPGEPRQGGIRGRPPEHHHLKWLGLASGETLFELDLETPEGKAALARLTARAPGGNARASPLGALVEHVKDCASIGDVRTLGAALGS
jgi:hypothetical protein